MSEKVGRVDLIAGVHALRVEYMQGAAPRVALQLFAKSPAMPERIMGNRL
jgi:hypothetical protein